jgi:hypothetical protein
VTLDLAGKAASVRVLLPDTGLPVPCTTALVTTAGGTGPATCTGGTLSVPAGATELVLLSAFGKGVVTASLFDDADRDGRRGATEAPLADWPVALVTSAGVEVARTTTDVDGRATAVVTPGTYRVVPQAPTAAVPWTATGTPADVVVPRAGTAATTSGWVQPGSVSVGVFHDLDDDGLREPGDLPLADRTVQLLSSTGSLQATAYTDASGRAAFPAKAGTSYQITVLTQTGWRATSPRSGTTVLTKVPVTAPADGGQATVDVGHYGTVDRTPPPAPTADVPAGPLTAPTLVTLATPETGATIRFTLDGTAPTANRGMVYSTPVRISMDRVLRAIAVDAAGNASKELAAAYDLPWTGTSGTSGAVSWSVTSGGTPRGGAAETSLDDGKEMAVGSVPVAARPTVDVTANVVVPTDLRKAAALNVSTSLRSTMRSTRLRVQYWDVTDKVWRVLTTTSQGLDEAKLDVDLGAASRVVDVDGTLKVRFIADLGQPFDLAVDQLAVTAQNRV